MPAMAHTTRYRAGIARTTFQLTLEWNEDMVHTLLLSPDTSVASWAKKPIIKEEYISWIPHRGALQVDFFDKFESKWNGELSGKKVVDKG